MGKRPLLLNNQRDNSMDSELEQFKKKIQGYSILQLEEIVISIDKDKYPDKLSVAREVLIAKKLELPSAPTEVKPQTEEESSSEPEAMTQPLPNILSSLPPKEEVAPVVEGSNVRLKEKSPRTKNSQWMVWLLSGFAALTSMIAIFFIVLPQTQWAGKNLWVRVGSQITGVPLTDPAAEKEKEPVLEEPVSEDPPPSSEDSL